MKNAREIRWTKSLLSRAATGLRKASPLTILRYISYNISVKNRSIHTDPVCFPPTVVTTIGKKLRVFSFAQPKALMGLVLVCGLLLAASCGRVAPHYEPGTIEVTSTDVDGASIEGASIWFDGEDTGEVTPFTFTELEADRYEISVVLDGFFPDPDGTVVELHNAEYLVQNFELSNTAPTLLTVTSTPAGASIFINGEDSGEITPATIPDLEAGDVEVQLVQQGMYVSPASFTATVVAHETTVLPDETFAFRWKKTVMLEGFSNVECDGCPELAENLEAFMHDSGYGLDRAIYCKFSMSWPLQSDPFYQYNIGENNDRMYFYQTELAGGIPALTLDGTLTEGTSNNTTPTATEIAAMMENAVLAEPGFLIDVTADFSNTSIPAEIKLTAMQDVDLSDHTLYIALVQSYFLSDEAFQDVVDFHWLFRDRVDNLPTLSNMTNGQELVFNETLLRSDWDLETLYVVAFVQNNLNKEILQAGISAATGAPAPAPASLFINNKTNHRPTLGGNRP